MIGSDWSMGAVDIGAVVWAVVRVDRADGAMRAAAAGDGVSTGAVVVGAARGAGVGALGAEESAVGDEKSRRSVVLLSFTFSSSISASN